MSVTKPNPPEKEVSGVPKAGHDEKSSENRVEMSTAPQYEYIYELGDRALVRVDLSTSQVVQYGEEDENDIYNDDDLDAALSYFRRERQALERDHLNSYVAVDVATGNMAVAATHIEAVDAFEAKFGPARTLTFHIGTTD